MDSSYNVFVSWSYHICGYGFNTISMPISRLIDRIRSVHGRVRWHTTSHATDRHLELFVELLLSVILDRFKHALTVTATLLRAVLWCPLS